MCAEVAALGGTKGAAAQRARRLSQLLSSSCAILEQRCTAAVEDKKRAQRALRELREEKERQEAAAAQREEEHATALAFVQRYTYMYASCVALQGPEAESADPEAWSEYGPEERAAFASVASAGLPALLGEAVDVLRRKGDARGVAMLDKRMPLVREKMAREIRKKKSLQRVVQEQQMVIRRMAAALGVSRAGARSAGRCCAAPPCPPPPS